MVSGRGRFFEAGAFSLGVSSVTSILDFFFLCFFFFLETESEDPGAGGCSFVWPFVLPLEANISSISDMVVE